MLLCVVPFPGKVPIWCCRNLLRNLLRNFFSFRKKSFNGGESPVFYLALILPHGISPSVHRLRGLPVFLVTESRKSKDTSVGWDECWLWKLGVGFSGAESVRWSSSSCLRCVFIPVCVCHFNVHTWILYSWHDMIFAITGKLAHDGRVRGLWSHHGIYVCMYPCVCTHTHKHMYTYMHISRELPPQDPCSLLMWNKTLSSRGSWKVALITGNLNSRIAKWRTGMIGTGCPIWARFWLLRRGHRPVIYLVYYCQMLSSPFFRANTIVWNTTCWPNAIYRTTSLEVSNTHSGGETANIRVRNQRYW